MKKHTLKQGVINMTGYPEKKVTALILSGKVLVNEVVITKAGEKINVDSDIRIKEENPFVSRGAYKLLKGIAEFNPIIADRVCLDAGSSTGGFTEVLLLNNARKVYAVDCGSNQLDYKLRIDHRVVSMENIRIQDLLVTDFDPVPDFVVADLSFTSSVPIIDHVFSKINIREGIILIKPQFEYQRLKKILSLDNNFFGVVKSETDRVKIKDYICNEINALGITVEKIIDSPIPGTNGNIEYLSYLRKV